MKNLRLGTIFLYSVISYSLYAQSDQDTTTVFMDTTSYLWPCCGDTDTRGWEPKTPDRALAALVQTIAREIDVNWEPDFIKLALCYGEACPKIKYFGTSKYLDANSSPNIYIVYHGPGYRSLLNRWKNDTLDFAIKSIIAHEIGHVAHHHPWRFIEPTQDIEEGCDYYMGKVMFNAWHGMYTKQQASYAIREIANIDPNKYYYSKSKRIEAIERGYDDAKDAYEKGHPDSNKSAQYAIESTHRSLNKTLEKTSDYEVLLYAKATSPFDSISQSEYQEHVEIISAKEKKRDSLTIVQYGSEYKLCLIDGHKKQLIQIGTIVPSGRSDYPYVVYDDTYYYWYVTQYMPGIGYDIYALNEKYQDKKLLIAEIKSLQKFEFDR